MGLWVFTKCGVTVVFLRIRKFMKFDACVSDPELSGQHFGRTATDGGCDRRELDRSQHLGLVTAEDVYAAGQQDQSDCGDGYGRGHRCACLGGDEPLE